MRDWGLGGCALRDVVKQVGLEEPLSCDAQETAANEVGSSGTEPRKGTRHLYPGTSHWTQPAPREQL